MIADGVRDTDLGAYQRAARTVLVHPLVTAHHPDGDALALVRRFAGPLARDLDQLCGYRLELLATCARLVRRLDRLDPSQVIQPRDRKAFDRRRYAYLALVLGALGRAGGQITLSELADALKRRAAEIADLGFDADHYRHRLAFVDVVSHLTELGVLRPVEVSAVSWLRDPGEGEALYDVDRDAVHAAFAPPRVLQHVRSVGALLAGTAAASRATRRAEARQRLARLIVEHPVVYLDDLGGADRAYLVSQARSLADDLHRLTGGQLERRAEGVALIDATGGFSDRRFPSGGTATQVALLLADAIAARVAAGDGPAATVPRAPEAVTAAVARIDAARPVAPVGWADADGDAAADTDAGLLAPASEGTDDDGDAAAGDPVAAPFFADGWLVEQAGHLCRTHGRAFAADLRDDPAALAAAAVAALADFDLVRRVPGGVVARPAAARYRDVQVATVAPPTPQLSLLDPAPEALS